ncbi:MAG: hypothetical protein ACR2ID_01725 [Chthoniobacterales bacterium]
MRTSAAINADGTINISDSLAARGGSGNSTPGAAPAEIDVSYRYDDDGRVKQLNVPPTAYNFGYNYDGMGRLGTITQFSDTSHSYRYFYDEASNVLERRNLTNMTSQFSAVDEINRLLERRVVANAYDGNNVGHAFEFSKERYGYDPMSRLVATDRTLRSGNDATDVKRDTFGYNPAGELTYADYDALPNAQGGFGPSDAVRLLSAR